MNDGFRQRLVGAIVLCCVALIVWPIIFGDGSSRLLDRRSQIPAVPAFEKYTVSAPVRSKAIEPVTSRVVAEPELSKPQLKETTAVKEHQSKLDSSGLPVSWTLQVASFKKQDNAEVLKNKLQKQGYKAYIRTIKSADRVTARVYVGPKLSKKLLFKDKLAIEKSYKLESLIIRFEP